ncbi:hypothetical protein FBY58_1332 [Zymomonas mobilis]|uniref:Uncharacterized protein n=2 Tax=Zymomonas mobilis TaxID=542 RepID=A0A542W2L3_ZYMMB|nr:hypothetical protein FBY58_1332 [Zymomonas mobilis]
MNTTDAKTLNTAVCLWKKPHHLGRMSFKEWVSVYFHDGLPVAYMALATALLGYLIGGFSGACIGYMAGLLGSYIYLFETGYIRHGQSEESPTFFNSGYALEITKEYPRVELYSEGEILSSPKEKDHYKSFFEGVDQTSANFA